MFLSKHCVICPWSLVRGSSIYLRANLGMVNGRLTCIQEDICVYIGVPLLTADLRYWVLSQLRNGSALLGDLYSTRGNDIYSALSIT